MKMNRLRKKTLKYAERHKLRQSFFKLSSLITMMKPNSWPEKQHDHLQRELRGQRNLERLQSDVIKYINMFSHLPARTKLYELFVPQRGCRNVNDCKVKWIMPSGSCWLVLTSSKEGSYWLLTFKCYSSTIFWGWADHVDRQGLKDKHLHSKTHIGASAIDSTERRRHSSTCARLCLWAQHWLMHELNSQIQLLLHE